jgi:NRPS condensation-like uncharacterized protein
MRSDGFQDFVVPTPKLIPLNRSEHMYWAAEGHIGPINQPYILRFNQALNADLVRQTLRELTTAFPRMRGVVEPSAFGHHLRILDDDRLVDQLFDDAFRVGTGTESGVDPNSRESLATFHTRFLNEPMSLERGLPWRARLLPHPTQPALMFSVHHIIGDGRSMVQMLCAILGRLNGQAVAACQLDSPSMMPAVTPPHGWQWPGCIWRWWRDSRAEARQTRNERVITLAQCTSPRFTTSTILYHELPCPADTMRALAKAHGTTVNTLLTAMLANTFLALDKARPAPHDGKRPVVVLRTSVDLRRYFPDGKGPEFGNFVSAFCVRAHEQASLAAQIASIEAQVKAMLTRYERRDFALPLSFYELLPLIGRTLYSHLIVQSKARGKLQPISCHNSSLGSAEFINPKGASLRLTELWPATVSTAFLVGAVSLNGQQFLSIIHQNDEIPSAAVSQFLATLDAQLQALLEEKAQRDKVHATA